MKLDYAINVLLSEKWRCEGSISIYEDKETVYFDKDISRKERIKMYKNHVKVLEKAIEILRRT